MRFYNAIGYGSTVETAPGVWDDIITERKYRGNVIRNTRTYSAQENSVNDDLTISNSISIVGDEYAMSNITAMRYVEFAGALWKVSNVEVQRPRLILQLGGVYNGPTAPAT